MFGPRPRSTLVLFGLVLSLMWSRHEPLAAGGPVRLAVIEFESAASDSDLAPLGKGLQSMLTTDLTGVPGVQVVERQQLKAVLKELDLAKSGAGKGRMDKSTIAKIGKLAGASRLLGGSFTVVGAKMRLDGRLYAVETGEVLTAASIDGDKDAFFELEKQLAQKVVEGLGVVLKPKDRAVLAKVHTADFEAFRAFSRGLAAFDDNRYQDAIAALGDATRRDKDFVLAARTLDEYEKLISELRGRAENMTQKAEAEADARAHREQATRSAEWGPTIDALWKIASKEGEGQTQLDRIAATFLLAAGYEADFQLRFPLGDFFALDRTADELEKRYFMEAKALFPRIPPFVAVSYFQRPEKNEPVEAWVRRTFAALEARMSSPRHENVLDAISREISNLQGGSSERVLARRLQLDECASLRLGEQLLDWGDALDPKHDFRPRFDELMAELYRRGLELEHSTASFAAVTKHKDMYPAALEGIASQIEKNKRLVKMLAEAKNPFVKEMLILGGLNMEEVVKQCLNGPAPTDEGMLYVAGERGLSEGRFVYVDELPVWLVREGGGGHMLTGPRSDQRRTSELRYFPHVKERTSNSRDDNAPEDLVVVGARPRRDGSLSFKVTFTPAADVWSEDASTHTEGAKRAKGAKTSGKGEEAPSNAQVGVAFGIRNARGAEPTTGYVVFLGASELEVSRFTLTKGKDMTGKERLTTTPLTKRAYEGLAGHSSAVTVRLAGQTAEITVGGHKTAVEIPAERDGFQGLFFRNFGYAAISHLTQN